ncbi:MAG: hypothetical protein SCAL_001389 [Candidatus Syntrophoarchaeum caldarius]|uniref:Uncharacterized protein n=1 Tax=Candidatus Syntropharchaeum caldarium TaxID=1838285 RepID=A0A1F2P9S8_9EURY|nr:MAG: hypothetical protein SCAL_001389 [Candidatus Syntrophoarchaeum caldarius]
MSGFVQRHDERVDEYLWLSCLLRFRIVASFLHKNSLNKRTLLWEAMDESIE